MTDKDTNNTHTPGGESRQNTASDGSISGKAGKTYRNAADGTQSKLGKAVENFAVNATAKMPMRIKFWNGLLRASYRGLAKASSADALVHAYRPSGRVDVMPAQYQAAADSGGKPLWITPDEQDWWVPNGGSQDTVFGPGNVPCLMAASDSYAVNNELKARCAEALDLGHDAPLYENPQIDVFEVTYEDLKDGEAVTDGGAAQTKLDVRDVGELKDHLIDISGTDSRILSYDKYKETHPEKLGSEEHQNSEDRGRLSEQNGDMSAYAMKMLLIAGLIIVGALLAVFVLPELVSGGSGGGGGMLDGVSLMASMGAGL